MLQLTYEPDKATAADVWEEAIQTAAMALRLAMSLDHYEYKRGEQHQQADDYSGLTPELSRTDLRPRHCDNLRHCAEAAKRSRLERIVRPDPHALKIVALLVDMGSRFHVSPEPVAQ